MHEEGKKRAHEFEVVLRKNIFKCVLRIVNNISCSEVMKNMNKILEITREKQTNKETKNISYFIGSWIFEIILRKDVGE